MRELVCPCCDLTIEGGMTMVRHLVDAHEWTSQRANDVVDEMYENQK